MSGEWKRMIRHVQRPDCLTIGRTQLPLPIFFPSVSSVKTSMPPQHYVELLNSLSAINRQFLISAYDIGQASIGDNELLIEFLSKAHDNGTLILMDSGNYESYWKNTAGEWTQTNYHTILNQLFYSFAFGFDEQFPPFDLDAHVRLIIERWALDKAAAKEKQVIPIVHGTASELPELVTRIAEATHVTMIAVPERKLGYGIFERAKTVSKIRQALDATTKNYIALHLLGTGNPISIAIYALSGADSFDGLEWCQTVVDHETALLHHLAQADFFRGQTAWGDEELSFQARTLAHNLEFYVDWMDRLRNAIHFGKSVAFCRANFPERIFYHCSAEFGWEGVL
jgi:hypothetical protein